MQSTIVAQVAPAVAASYQSDSGATNGHEFVSIRGSHAGYRMRLAVASDHAGYDLKQEVGEYLRELGCEVVDLGAYNRDPVDYPDYAEAIGAAILKGAVDRGVLICGSGVGASVSANKIPGIRAGICHDTYSAHQGVEHDDMNVLVLGGRIVGSQLARELVRAFIGAHFSGEERHCRRLAKVKALESRYRGTQDEE